MASRRRACFAFFAILLLLPVSSYSLILPQGSISNPQTGTSSLTNNANGTSTIPLALPPALSGSVPLGPINPATPVSLGLVLPPKDQGGLRQYINEVSSPSSKEYHNFLSQQQYAELYGPSAPEAQSLKSFLTSKGLSVSFDKYNPDLMFVVGTAANAENTLHVSIQSFKVGSSVFYSATSGLELPSQFSNIQTAFGLTNYGSGINVTETPMYRVLGPIGSTQTSTSNSVYYSPSELRQIYNATSLLNSGYTGSGVTIAIVDAYGDPFIQQELDNFSSAFNLPQTNVTQICVDGPCDYALGVTTGWNTEIALDVEWAHAMAPDASINLYIGSNSSFPLFDAVQKAVSDGVNSIISMSWGSPENSFGQSGPIAPVFGENYPWLDQVLQQAAAEGITAFASSGDWGAYNQAVGETSPYGGAIYPSTDPYVTGVGGTSLYMNVSSGYLQFPYSNATGSYGTETAWSWSDYFGGATGGGYSTFFGAPQWQSGPGFSSSSRGAPDVAWDADPQTGVIVSLSNGAGSGFTYYVIGGTSVGSPSWAGSLALIEQKAGGRLGLINPELYSILNNTSEYSKAFHDVTTGNNNPNSSGPGWDALTGMGSPNLGVLADYLAPTGSLSVSVRNQLSGSLTRSYSYGMSIVLTANVTTSSLQVTTGSVHASILGPSGQKIGTDIPLAYSSATKTWSGSYTIKPSDPAGMWTAEVSASSGSLSGEGYTSFSVGDGVTLFLPYYNTTTQNAAPVFLLTGERINVSALVTNPSGQCCVSAGNFEAVFTLGTPSGKTEGKIPLSYNAASGAWQGTFPIPNSADQGAWVLTVNGTDSNGNSGMAYSWLNVGLNVLLTTDSPSYITGDSVTIFAAPEYPNGLITALGNFSATISSGSRVITEVPMTFSWVYGLWIGTFTLSTSYSPGFFTLTVGGNDGAGNSGSFSTIIRVAPYHLTGKVTLPSKSITINGGSEPTVTAKITYPNGTIMKSGSVEAFVSRVMDGTLVPIGHTRMSYQSSVQSFVGPNVLAAASPLKTAPGEYFVSVQAFDATGNYGNLTSTFFVNANPHSSITISNNAQFSSVNGVVGGSGTAYSPYIIAGWNTSSISISSNVTASFELLNDWVQGSSSNGVVITAPGSTNSIIENVYTVSNHGDGLLISNSSGISILGVDASNNSQSGIVISGSPKGTGELSTSAASNNGIDGIVLMDTKLYTLSSSSASNNAQHGFYLFNSENSTLFADNATSNSVGVYFTGTPDHGYGGSSVVGGNFIGNNIGIEVDGLDQNIVHNSNNLSSVAIYQTAQLENNIGTLGANDSVVSLQLNVIGFNNYGVVIQESLPLVLDNIISENAQIGMNITGSFTGSGHCQVTFTNSSAFDYSACVALDYLTLNGAGGLDMANLNGSFVYATTAVGNAGNGFNFANMQDSVISALTSIENIRDGMTISDSTSSTISANELGGNLNGLVVRSSANNTFDRNNATLNALDGMMFSTSPNNTISNNVAMEDAGACSSASGCTVAAGIELYGSSENLVTGNSLTNNTAPSGQGAGIYIDSGSAENFVLLNNATLNFAAISIADASSNNIAKNTFISDTYGIYLSNAPNNVVLSNNYRGLKQYQFPNQPSVSFSNIVNGTTYSGLLDLSWNIQGQSISSENLIIDGSSQTVNGTSLTLNSNTLPDAKHSITIQVTDTGGLTASSTIVISTRNHEGLIVQALGPGGISLSGVNVSLQGPGPLLNLTTDSAGKAVFKDLGAGTYLASTTVNGTFVSLPVNFNGNATVTLYVPDLITTFLATTTSGSPVALTLDGNITSANLSQVMLQNSNGVYGISFDVSGIKGTVGVATLSIPKTDVPGGLVPQLLVNGNSTTIESFTQDNTSYNVTFSTTLGSQTNVTIEFAHVVKFHLDVFIAIVLTVAALAAALVLAFIPKRRV